MGTATLQDLERQIDALEREEVVEVTVEPRPRAFQLDRLRRPTASCERASKGASEQRRGAFRQASGGGGGPQELIQQLLAVLPPRMLPSRSFVTACLRLAQALRAAWCATEVLETPEKQRQALRRLVGASRWASKGLKTSIFHGFSMIFLRKLMNPKGFRSQVGPRCSEAWWQDAHERSSSPSTAWVACALEDCLGAVAAHALKGRAARPATGGEFRPPSRGGRKEERYRLLAIKHFAAWSIELVYMGRSYHGSKQRSKEAIYRYMTYIICIYIS